jgi:hypothetical protein
MGEVGKRLNRDVAWLFQQRFEAFRRQQTKRDLLDFGRRHFVDLPLRPFRHIAELPLDLAEHDMAAFLALPFRAPFGPPFRAPFPQNRPENLVIHDVVQYWHP